MTLHEFLKEHGLSFEPVLDNKIHRCDRAGTKKDDDIWYIGSNVLLPSGKTRITLTVGDHTTGEKWYFPVKNGVAWSEEDRKYYESQAKKAQEIEERDTREKQESAAREADKIWQSAGPASSEHPYVKRKKIGKDCIGLIKQSGGSLLIPVRGIDNSLRGLQFIDDKGNKKFLYGTKKQGSCFKFPRNGSEGPIVLCEGFATGASINEATGFETYISFDAGNLGVVGKYIRGIYPSHRIIIAGDDDKWTETGKNVGREKATAAAKDVGGVAIFPKFVNTLRNETDFNDVHCLEGLESVRRQIELGIESLETGNGNGEGSLHHGGTNEESGSTDDCNSASNQSEIRRARGKDSGESTGYIDDTKANEGGGELDPIKAAWDPESIKYLGFADGKHSYLSKYSKKIVMLSPSAHTELNLLELMPLGFWDSKYGGFKETIQNGKPKIAKVPIKWNQAADELMRNSLKTGYFDPGRIKGTGVFREGGKVIVNTGNKLYVDGKEVDPTTFKTQNIYIPGPKITCFEVEPATIDDCLELIDMSRMLLWSKKEEAKLFLGWLVCAILSGSLKWRPHLYITGAPGIGKSWILENIAYPLTSEFSEYFLSNSSEAGIRQSIKNNALSVIWDEPESNNITDNIAIQKVLALARQSSFESAGRVSKGSASGNATEFSIKSCFLLGSIKDAVQEGADLTRFTILNLTKIENKVEAMNHFQKLERVVYNLTDSDFPRRFARMVLNRVREFESNNEILKKIVAIKHNSRVGQQYGALLAGYALLEKDGVISEEYAASLANEIEDQENVKHDSHEDISEALDYLMSKMIVVDAADGNSGTARMTVGEITEKHTMHDRLEGYGMRVIVQDEIKYLFVAYKNPELRTIYRDSKWVSGWGRSLAKIPGSKRATVRLSGIVKKGVLVPI